MLLKNSVIAVLRSLSVSSPIARALIGKHEGDTAEVRAPGGAREYEVLAVRYG